ncbi:MAG: ABC transporter permease, partial [Bacteroidetes bacterium]|nr:ABC transporter permease [Bacteroidota bacterium]
WFCDPELFPFIEGDLIELFYERVSENGPKKARRQFVLDVLLLFRPGIIRPLVRFQSSMNYSMFRNYFKTGFRNILKYKAFSSINIFGLAVSMSVCMLIIMMLVNQKKYDRFHENKERVYRVLVQNNDFPIPNGTSQYPLASELKNNYPIVENTTQIIRKVGGDISYDQKILTIRGFFAEPSFFDVFSFELAFGNEKQALSAPNTMVISAPLAKKLFGSDDWQNAIGKTVSFTDLGLLHLDIGGVNSEPVDWGDLVISGVLADLDYKSHLKFDVLMSVATRDRLIQERKITDLTDNWRNNSMVYNYVMLKEGKKEKDLAIALNEITANKLLDRDNQPTGAAFIPQKLTQITPGRFVGNPTSFRMPIEGYYILGLLALVIMISACLNYANLSIARSLTRAKEIGVRKVGGATRRDLILQFLTESILTALVAMVLAVMLLMAFKPAFMGLWVNQYLNFDLESTWGVYLIFVGFAMVIGLIAGAYPAFQMSKFLPIETLKAKIDVKPGKLGLRKVLSITQFVVSILFITTSILIYNQFRYLVDFKYEFAMDNIVNIELQSNDYQLVKQAVAEIPGVELISACAYIPASGINNSTQVRKPGGDEKDILEIARLEADENFVENLQLNLITGRNFSPASTGISDEIIINRAALSPLGYSSAEEALGQTVVLDHNQTNLQIIGVLEDFRFLMPIFDGEIGPMYLRNKANDFAYLNVRIHTNDQMALVEQLGVKWEEIDPIHDFKYQFFDEQIANTNLGFRDIVSVLGFITFLAIIISCLGLLGMATYSAERRTKEVGIRKVLGADSFQLAYLLSREFLTLLVISVIIAAPLSYFLNNLWLENLPNRVDFGFGTVFLGAVSLLVLGLLTIGSQTYRIAKSDPVDSLRME